jgi:hypothetical protein
MSHTALNDEQFGQQKRNLAQMLGVHPALGGSRVPDILQGRAALHVMHEADIRQTHPKVEAPHIADAGFDVGHTLESGYPRGEVWTSQRHLHTPTLHRYAQGDVPQYDPDEFMGSIHGDPEPPEEERTPYEPETYEHGGREWLLEGHHRTVAARLAR